MNQQNKNTALVSVIVPIYGVEACLDRCVRSVLSQTDGNFRLILVDDGSLDRCGEMCDAWARHDPRITVIHQLNGGPSAARNAGLDLALADPDVRWVTFLDPDDALSPVFLAEMKKGVETVGGTIACTTCRRVTDETSVGIAPESVSWGTLRPEAYWRRYDQLPMTACGKLFPRRLFDSVRFPVGRRNEDEYVTYRLLFACETVAFSDESLYDYYQRKDSIMHCSCSGRMLDIVPALSEQIAFMRMRGLEDVVAHTQDRLVRLCGWVAASFDKSRAENEFLRARLEDAHVELDAIRRSVAYRVGRLICLPGRVIKRILGGRRKGVSNDGAGD